jgi:hypothetical protein
MLGNLLQILSMGLPEAMQAYAKQYGPVFKVTTAMCGIHNMSPGLVHWTCTCGGAPRMSPFRGVAHACSASSLPLILKLSALPRSGKGQMYWWLWRILWASRPSTCATTSDRQSSQAWLVGRHLSCAPSGWSHRAILLFDASISLLEHCKRARVCVRRQREGI